ncbi:hypothetical protein AAVH_11265 [Aphelenchoides avenae]|nr:hypothetical protein AAVH_11265 [Aphelenchus avenae]
MFKIAAIVVVLVVFADAAPKCGKFEKFVQQSTPEGTCASPKPRNTPKGPPKCQCVSGCVRYKKQCIPAQQCPVATTATPTTTAGGSTASTTASTSQASTTVSSTSTASSSASPSTTVASTSVSPVASTGSTSSTSVSPATSTAQSSTSAGSTQKKSNTTAAPSTTQKPAGAKCLKYLPGVCKNVSPKESDKCKTACKKEGFSFGNCAKLIASANFGAVICVCT